MNKTLTISIAAYNCEKYINDLLDNFCSMRNFNELEIFVIDDGGKDNTLDIAKNYERKYPDVIHAIHKENGGWGSTLNYSFDHCTGKYFKQLDGDDYLDSTNLVNLIEILHQSDADLICSPFITFEDSTNKILGKEDFENIDLKFDHVYPLDDVVDQVPLSMHSIIVKSEILKDNQVHIDEHCFYTDIEYLLYSILHCNSVVFTEAPIYYYRLARNGQSCSMDGLIRHYKDHLFVVNKLLEFYENNFNGFSTNKKNMFSKRICQLCGAQYGIFSMRGKFKENKAELIEYNNVLKRRYPYFYNNCTCARIMKLFRKNDFKFYNFMLVYYRIKYSLYKY